MSFKSISPAQQERFLFALRSGQYNLLLGAGSSMDSTNSHGKLPSGEAFRDELCDLKKVQRTYTLQRVFSLLTPAEIKEHVTDRLSGCRPGDTAKLISSIIWKRIFTWNADDVLENAYAGAGARQQLRSIHFADDFVEHQSLAELLLIHLHGFVGTPEKGYVFSREQYLRQIRTINPWMTVLTQFMLSEPMIVAGTSLDEVDLDFYLAQRTAITARDDRGPSILVTTRDDAVSARLCEDHNLLLFIGRSHDFFSHCLGILPHPPTPEELIPLETKRL